MVDLAEHGACANAAQLPTGTVVDELCKLSHDFERVLWWFHIGLSVLLFLSFSFSFSFFLLHWLFMAARSSRKMFVIDLHEN